MKKQRRFSAAQLAENSQRSATFVVGPTKTQQQFREEADINTIVRRFKVTGLAPQGVRVPQYGDFTAAVDFRQSMDAIRAAQISFMAMPAKVRERFGNDPQSFLEFCSDANNLDEMRKLGLAVPKKEDAKPAEKPAEKPAA